MDWELERLNSTNDTFDPNAIYIAQFPLITRILGVVVGLLSTTSNVLTILTVSKYATLHNRTYWYIVNWCLCNVFITASLPYMYNSFGIINVMNESILCIWDENAFNFLTGNQIFVAIIVIDWYITTFANQRKCAIRCRKAFKTFIVLVWLFLLSLILVTTSLCVSSLSFPVPIICYACTYVGIFVLLIIIFVLRCVKLKNSSVVYEKSKLEFRLAFSYFICWLFNTLFLLNINYFYEHFSSSTNHIILQMSMMIGFCHAVVLFVILYILDKNFRLCLRTMFHLPVSDIDHEIRVKQDLLEFL
ncbi:uncharacterized protein [Diabrotica undecimpunctata]|uniref:uncharacterized protein n=1 Tax=Diabrotica undecimpunctata TaxID=50387 RepID=UPI003B6400FA